MFTEKLDVRVRNLIALSFALGLFSQLLPSCSTTQIKPLAELPASPPPYVEIPHPEGLDTADLFAVFADRQAPPIETLKNCDLDFRRLNAVTASRDELIQGTRELVRLDPVKYHWCFYSKVIEMDETIKTLGYVDERQKALVEAYAFLSPMAHAFYQEYQDSRYLRWAIVRYKRASEVVFFRKVDLTLKMTRELAITDNPLGIYRAQKESAEDLKYGSLEKYGLLKTMEPILAKNPNPDSPPVATYPNREAAAVPVPVQSASPGPSPVAVPSAP